MSTPEEKHNPLCSASLRVAIVAGTEHQRTCLKQILEENGLQITDDEVLQGDKLNAEVVDVLLVNLDDADEGNLEIYLEQTAIPVLLNDSASIRTDKTPCGRAWGRRLTEKLIDLSTNAPVASELKVPLSLEVPELQLVANNEEMLASSSMIDEVEPLDEVEIIDKETEELTITSGQPVFDEENITQELQANQDEAIDLDSTLDLQTDELPCSPGISEEDVADEIWVLGASIGGPDAIKQFLSSIPSDFPAGFILVQHIGAGFVTLLAEQLGRICSLEVLCAKEGRAIKRNQLIVAPVGKNLGFFDDGRVRLTNIIDTSIYSPSIDNVMLNVAKQYGSNARAILFSGMGNDGLKGAQEIAAKEGIVWAQEPDSCLISSMVDSVQEAGLVSETDTPENLAMKLVQFVSEEALL